MTRSTIILSAARFGGAYLMDLHAQLRPGDLHLNEIFRPGSDSLPELTDLLNCDAAEVAAMAQADPSALWRRITVAANRPVVARLYPYHQPRHGTFWADIAGQSRIIHLIRHNLLAAFASRQAALNTGRWQRRRGALAEPPAAPIRLNVDEADAYIRERRADIDWARDVFAGADYHELSFEEITAGPASCTRALARIYGDADPLSGGWKLRPSMTPIRRRSLADTIANYSDLAHLDRVY